MAELKDTFKINKSLFHVLSKINTNKGQYPFESRFKSAHTISAKDIWVDNIPYCGSFQEALDFSLTEDGQTIIKLYEDFTLTPVPNTNGQAYYIEDNGQFIRPFIVPEDVPHPDTNLPSIGFNVVLSKGDGSTIPPTSGAYVVDSYSGLILFDEGQTPTDLNWGDIKISVFVYIGSTLEGFSGGGGSGLSDLDVIDTYLSESSIDLFDKVDDKVKFKVLKNLSDNILLVESPTGVITVDIQNIATLQDGKISINQIPQSISAGLVYKGKYDPETNTPDINSISKLTGDFWISTKTFGDYSEGNWIIWNGITFDIWLFTNSTVSSVNTKTGDVIINGNDIEYINTVSGLSSTTLQEAIDEIDSKVDILESDIIKVNQFLNSNTITKRKSGTDIYFDLEYENGNGVSLSESVNGFRADLNLDSTYFQTDVSKRLTLKTGSITPNLLKSSSGMYDGQLVQYDAINNSFKFIDIPGLSGNDEGTIFQRNINFFGKNESFFISGLDAYNERMVQIYQYYEAPNPYISDTYIYSDFSESNFDTSDYTQIKTDLQGLKLISSGHIKITIQNNSTHIIETNTPIRINGIQENIINIIGRYFKIEDTIGTELPFCFDDTLGLNKSLSYYVTGSDTIWVKINSEIPVSGSLDLYVIEDETENAVSPSVLFDLYEDFTGNHLQSFTDPLWTPTTYGQTLLRYHNKDNNEKSSYLQNYAYYKSGYTRYNFLKHNNNFNVNSGCIIDFGQYVYSGNSYGSWWSRINLIWDDFDENGDLYANMEYGRIGGNNWTRLKYTYNTTTNSGKGTACSYGGSTWKNVSLEVVPDEPLSYMEGNRATRRVYGIMPSTISSKPFRVQIYTGANSTSRANMYHYLSYMRYRKYYDELTTVISFTNETTYNTNVVEVTTNINSEITLNKIKSINQMIFNDSGTGLTYLFSNQDKVTWYKYNSVSGAFEESLTGNTSVETALIPSSVWNTFITNNKSLNIKFIFDLDGTETVSPSLKDIILSYERAGSWKLISGKTLEDNFDIEHFPYETKITNKGLNDFDNLKINLVVDKLVDSALDNFMMKSVYDILDRGFVDKAETVTNGNSLEDISHSDLATVISEFNIHSQDASKHFVINDNLINSSSVYSSFKIEERISNHTHDMTNLSDVDITLRADGTTLVWDSDEEKYTHGLPESGASTIEELTDVDTTLRADGTTLVWDETETKYIHGVTSSLEYKRLRKYIFTSTDVTNAQTDGYLIIDIMDSNDVILNVNSDMNINGIEIIIGRLNTYYGDVSLGDDWELIQNTAPVGYVNQIKIHSDWIIEGEAIWGYVIKDKE